MKISSRYRLKQSQFELDFIDVDTNKDKRLFVDPHLLSSRVDPWSQEAVKTVQSFFSFLLRLLKDGRTTEAEEIFSYLGEPNETCLGLSKARPSGRGVGPEDTRKIFESLSTSKAVKTGLIEDIEDCVIFVENFGPDKLSDMTTNIIRSHLIEYTQSQCRLWDIPLQPNVASGALWDSANLRWYSIHTEMLTLSGKSFLLVPKGIVSRAKVYDPKQFHQHDVLNFMQSHHLKIRSALVGYRSLKNKRNPGAPFVTKKSIIEHDDAEFSKEFLTNFALKHGDVFQGFKNKARGKIAPLENEEISDRERLCDVCDHLLSSLQSVQPGNAQASVFHKLVTGVLELCFYPYLSNPKKEHEINEGRKRIDIMFDNSAKSGFFFDVIRTHDIPCHLVAVECKNYSQDPQNPEVDQLAGRLSNHRGKVGILVCRELTDRARLIKRCADFWKDQQSLLLPLDDTDLRAILTELRDSGTNSINARLLALKSEVIGNS